MLRAILVVWLFVLTGSFLPCAFAGDNTCPVGPHNACPANDTACCFPNGTLNVCTIVGQTCCPGTVGVTIQKSYCTSNEICAGAPPTCRCPLDKEKCGDNCVDTDLDNQNCGGCGNVCITNGGHTCWDGNCTCPPSIPEACADGMCVNFEHDPTHCGGCGYRCKSGRCIDGRCSQPDLPTGGGSGSSGGSAGGSSSGRGGPSRPPVATSRLCPATSPAKCDGRCVNTMHDPQNCGQCGRECNAGYRCIAGDCRQLDIHAP
jgi:hypothetical protein